MRRTLAALLMTLLAGAGCLRSNDSGPQTRTILADFSFDEFNTIMLKFFPRVVTLRPGDTAHFKQTWTGEPHSVTMGTTVDQAMKLVVPYIEAQEKGTPLPDEEPPEVREAFEPLPFMFGDKGEVNQTAAQPCYLDEGLPPQDGAACRKRKQPPFNGKQTYYNSGFIPYEGQDGNTVSVKLADDIAPGTYNFYCNLHGALMSGQIVVKPKGAKIPSQDEVNRKARSEIEKLAAPLKKAYNEAKAGKAKLEETEVPLPLSGFGDPAVFEASISEFIPRSLNVKAGEKVTWSIFGGHTISFDVPRYFPIIEIAKNGTVKRNPRLDPPAGGSPPLPEEDETESERSSEPLAIDGGTWDGSGFFSSGLIYGQPYTQYSLRFSKPGKYRFACLVHPPMVGTVVVK